MKKKLSRRTIYTILIVGTLSILALFFVLPYIWMLLNSFKSTKEILMRPKSIIPEKFTVAGYIKVLTQSPFFSWLKNSLVVTITNTVVILFTSSLVGYVFSKFKFKGNKLLFVLLQP